MKKRFSSCIHLKERKIVIIFLDNMVRRPSVSELIEDLLARLTLPLGIIKERSLDSSMLTGVEARVEGEASENRPSSWSHTWENVKEAACFEEWEDSFTHHQFLTRY